jgi:hypothetical protein
VRDVSNDLFIEGPDDIANAPLPKRRQRRQGGSAGNGNSVGRHIGWPLSWFTWVYPVLHSKGELAVALYLYRLRAIQHSRTVKVSNVLLLVELGIDRHAKYRALRRLADAGIITVRRKPHRSLEIVFHRRRPNKKPA